MISDIRRKTKLILWPGSFWSWAIPTLRPYAVLDPNWLGLTSRMRSFFCSVGIDFGAALTFVCVCKIDGQAAWFFFCNFDPNNERHKCSKFREGVPIKPRNVPRSFGNQIGLAFLTSWVWGQPLRHRSQASSSRQCRFRSMHCCWRQRSGTGTRRRRSFKVETMEVLQGNLIQEWTF